ncbi:MAG TPA: tryptophan synthase subunit alpha [Desulfotomaculum sp.]|nr:tryptophan synthase subunit alpha [Desulfotomaculum sp.]
MSENRITLCLAGLARRGKKGLITYITAGDPDLAATARLVETMVSAGADMVEIGIPFSDPVADGPVIQQASARALAKGVRVREIIRMCAAVRQRVTAPLILMTYYNPVFQYGLADFARDAASAGVDGLIVPDLPIEESGELLGHTDQYGLALIPLAAPTSTAARLAAMAPLARGFVYCVSVTGVTGARQEIHTDLAKFMHRVRQHISLPAAIGFGISGPESAARVAPHCDALVVGSAIVNLVARAKGSDPAPAVAALVGEIRKAIDGMVKA